MFTNRKRQATQTQPAQPEESALEGIGSLVCNVVVFLFAVTFIAQNFIIPSASMASTLLVGDHVVADKEGAGPHGTLIDRLLPSRDLRRGDPVVFYKPVLEADGTDLIMVKRVIGVPGDRIHLRDGIVYLNGVAQDEPKAAKPDSLNHDAYRDDFPAVSPDGVYGVTARWALDLPGHVEGGDLIVPLDSFFVMGDNRTNSLDGRYWGFVSRSNVIGRPLFIYWSFDMAEQSTEPTAAESLALTLREVTHFFSDTRWRRTLQRVN